MDYFESGSVIKTNLTGSLTIRCPALPWDPVESPSARRTSLDAINPLTSRNMCWINLYSLQITQPVVFDYSNRKWTKTLTFPLFFFKRIPKLYKLQVSQKLDPSCAPCLSSLCRTSTHVLKDYSVQALCSSPCFTSLPLPAQSFTRKDQNSSWPTHALAIPLPMTCEHGGKGSPLV